MNTIIRILILLAASIQGLGAAIQQTTLTTNKLTLGVGLTNLPTVAPTVLSLSVLSGTNILLATNGGVITFNLSNSNLFALGNNDGSYLTNSVPGGATNAHQFVTLQQLESSVSGGTVAYLDTLSPANGFTPSGTVLATNYTAVSLPAQNTNTAVTAANGQYIAKFISTNTFTSFASGLAVVEVYMYEELAGSGAVTAEAYVINAVTKAEEYEFTPSPAYQTVPVGSTPTKLTFSIPVTDYVSTTNLHLAIKFKVLEASTPDPTIRIVTGGVYPSHVSFAVPASAFVSRSGDTMTGLLAADGGLSVGVTNFVTAIGGKQNADNDLLRLATIASSSGDVIYRDAVGWTNLAVGLDGKFLKLVGGFPSWQDDNVGAPGSGDDVYVNHGDVVHPNFTNAVAAEITWTTDGGTNVWPVLAASVARDSELTTFLDESEASALYEATNNAAINRIKNLPVTADYLLQTDGVGITNKAVGGDVSFAGGNFTIGANSVALTTDTTGDYVATIAGDTEITVSGAGTEGRPVTLAIAASIARDSELHSAVTLAGANYLTLATQQITAGDVALTTHTSGNYTAAVQGTTAEVEVTGVAGEGTTFTLGLPDDLALGDASFTAITNTALTASKLVLSAADKSLTSSTLAESDIVTETSTESFQNKTLDAAATGNVLKQKKEIKLRFSDSVYALTMLPNTNNPALATFMRPVFADDAATNANYITWITSVPSDIDTATDLTARLYIRLMGADTATHNYNIGFANVADSAAIAASPGTWLNISMAADASGADGDLEIIDDVTLTGWRTGLTAKDGWMIRLARDGPGTNAADASTTDSEFVELVITYTSTQ